jgi:hypothetical protein
MPSRAAKSLRRGEKLPYGARKYLIFASGTARRSCSLVASRSRKA